MRLAGVIIVITVVGVQASTVPAFQSSKVPEFRTLEPWNPGTLEPWNPGTLEAASQPLNKSPQDEFVPIDQLPPQEELPAAPMVVAAYSFIWIAFVVYCLSLVRRVKKVEADLAALERERR
jgi:hypothetical protein